jgi:N-acetyl sugar amidotransferase
MCTEGVWDTTVPGINFDENGVSNYAKMFYKLCEAYPRGEKGRRDWENIVEKIKVKGKGKRYDCIVGVSGGTDSSYLLHIAKNEYGLRPLAVNLDNGWNSDIAVQNIKKITKKLNIDLETYVIDYEEVKAVLRAYMKASLPWVDGPTDIAIKSVLFKVAKREKIKYVLNGSDFRSEGKQPSEWTHTDARQMIYVIKKYEPIKLRTYPYLRLFGLGRLTVLNRIRTYRPYYYIDYQKKKAQEILKNEYDWKYYGGHHHENIFTKFAIAYWLPKKFGIDKRIITYSAQILSGEISRDEALENIKEPPYDPDSMERDKEYVIKKLSLSSSDFKQIWDSPNKYYWDYPSYMPILNKYFKLSQFAMKLFFPFTPSVITEKETR